MEMPYSSRSAIASGYDWKFVVFTVGQEGGERGCG